jgi:hypothetical protein
VRGLGDPLLVGRGIRREGHLGCAQLADAVLDAVRVQLPGDALRIALRVRPCPEHRPRSGGDGRDEVRPGDELSRRVGVRGEGEGSGGHVGVPAVLAQRVGRCGQGVLAERGEEGGTVGERLERSESHANSLARDPMNPPVSSSASPRRRGR